MIIQYRTKSDNIFEVRKMNSMIQKKVGFNREGVVTASNKSLTVASMIRVIWILPMSSSTSGFSPGFEASIHCKCLPAGACQAQDAVSTTSIDISRPRFIEVGPGPCAQGSNCAR